MNDLMSQILVERLSPVCTKTSSETTMPVDSSTIAEETSQMVIDDANDAKNSDGDCEIVVLETQADQLDYLMKCYERVSTLEKSFPKVH